MLFYRDRSSLRNTSQSHAAKGTGKWHAWGQPRATSAAHGSDDICRRSMRCNAEGCRRCENAVW